MARRVGAFPLRPRICPSLAKRDHALAHNQLIPLGVNPSAFIITNRRETEDAVRFDLLVDGQPVMEQVTFRQASTYVLGNIAAQDTYSYRARPDDEEATQITGARFTHTHFTRIEEIAKLPQELCKRCAGPTTWIGYCDIPPRRSGWQKTFFMQCQVCGLYRQVDFANGKDWAGETYRQLMQERIPFIRTARDPFLNVGDVYSIGYETALVQIHDFHRERVGGIPSLCFLIATRINPEKPIDYTKEDASIILLRVIDATSLPSDAEVERIRVEMAQCAVGPQTHWDEDAYIDAATHNQLSFAGIKCQVFGTFFLDCLPGNEDNTSLVLRFGSDLSNYYPNRGLKVYKPKGNALFRIVNYQDPFRIDERMSKSVAVGEVRYASTNRAFQGISNVRVELSPSDLLAQKTALFGMTRTGKSNTTKIMLKSVFELRFAADTPLRIGQIVFDQDGEYAKENEQVGLKMTSFE